MTYMKDNKELISLCIEMEGLLRLLGERENAHAQELLAEKYSRFKELMALADAQQTLVDVQAHDPHEEVKRQEAIEPEVEPEMDQAVEAVEKGDEATEALKHCKLGTPQFTINDRFRFRRDLFEGNDEDFTETLNLLADMDSYDEAEDYLVNDLMWDPEDPAVADFLKILKDSAK